MLRRKVVRRIVNLGQLQDFRTQLRNIWRISKALVLSRECPAPQSLAINKLRSGTGGLPVSKGQPAQARHQRGVGAAGPRCCATSTGAFIWGLLLRGSQNRWACLCCCHAQVRVLPAHARQVRASWPGVASRNQVRRLSPPRRARQLTTCDIALA